MDGDLGDLFDRLGRSEFRGCLAKWHAVPKGRPLTEGEKEYVLQVLRAWLAKAGGVE